MRSRHLSIRVPAELDERLRRRSEGSKSSLAMRLIDEGLRMDEHPGIVFRPGPAGRRPGLIGGPDVWEVARVIRGLRSRGERRIVETAELTGLQPHQVRTAERYYHAYRDEIDAWIGMVDDEASTARA